MARPGRKMSLAVPQGIEAFLMLFLGVRLTDEEPLRGRVIVQYTRHSDRPDCRCNTSGQLHGPYYCRTWTDLKGRRHKQYTRRSQVRQVLARVRQWHIENEPFSDAKALLSVYRGVHPLSTASVRDLKRKYGASTSRAGNETE